MIPRRREREGKTPAGRTIDRSLEALLVAREKIPARGSPPGSSRSSKELARLLSFIYVFQSSVGQLTIITSDVPRPRWDWRVKM